MEGPALIDNRDSNTLARALARLLSLDAGLDGPESGEPASEVRIATAFFSRAGFAHIADGLTPVPRFVCCWALKST